MPAQGSKKTTRFELFAPLALPSGFFVLGGINTEARVLDNRGTRHIVVAVNGNWDRAARLLAVLDQADLVIAADGGANALAAHGRTPHVLVGDMDSVAPETLVHLQRQGCRVLSYRPEKDETDTELALLEAVSLGARRITLLGALGGRIDHELANILLLAMPQLAGIETRIYDGRSYLSIVRDEATVHGQAGDLLSLIPLAGDAVGVVTEGLQYPLRGEVLHFGPARGVSNVFLGDLARLTLQSGQLLLVHTPQDEETPIHA